MLMIRMVCEKQYQIKSQIEIGDNGKLKTRRFFQMITKCPPEIQMNTVNAVYGISKPFIDNKALIAAAQKMNLLD